MKQVLFHGPRNMVFLLDSSELYMRLDHYQGKDVKKCFAQLCKRQLS